MEINKKYPYFYYDYKICIHCGKKTVVPVDKFGRETKVMIYPVSHMICKSCNRSYFIKWIKDNNNEMIPICCDDNEKIEVAESIIESAINYRKENKYE